MNKTGNPVVLVLMWAGRNRTYLVVSIVCAMLSGLMVAVPYLAVFGLMHAVYEGRCTTGTVAVDTAVLAAGVVLRFTMFGFSSALAHKGAYGALFDVRCRILERLSRAPLGELDERSTGRIKRCSPTMWRTSSSFSPTICPRRSCMPRGLSRLLSSS